MLCSNRPEGFVGRACSISMGITAKSRQGPRSHLYYHILTSCFLDTILVPLCTWIYLVVLIGLVIKGTRFSSQISRQSSKPHSSHLENSDKTNEDVEINELAAGDETRRFAKTHEALSILYYLLILAQILMCVLEIVRLSLAHLGVGLLPFTFVALITAAALRFTKGLRGKVNGSKYLNLALWIMLAVTNGVKVAEETKEGTGARKGSKYPVADEITDVSVMIGVYAALAALEVSLGILKSMRTVH